MQKLCRYVLMVSTVTALLFQAVLSSVSFQDYVYRRATSGDLLAVLDIMSAIESSKAHKYIVLYPYTMRAQKITDLINNTSLFVATSPEAVISTVNLALLPFEDVEKQMDETSMAGWRNVYSPDDIFITSDMWYTELHHRRHSIFTTLLGFGLQTLVPRMKQLVHKGKSLRVHFMVDCIEDKDNRLLIKKLIKCVSVLFQEFGESLHKKYFSDSDWPIAYSLNTFDITKSFFNPFVNELEVAITRAAKRYVFSAQFD